MQPFFKHGIWYPVVGADPPVLPQEQVFFTENPQTNYEQWQLEKYGNFIKARGTASDYDEFKQAFIYSNNK